MDSVKIRIFQKPAYKMHFLIFPKALIVIAFVIDLDMIRAAYMPNFKETSLYFDCLTTNGGP